MGLKSCAVIQTADMQSLTPSLLDAPCRLFVVSLQAYMKEGLVSHSLTAFVKGVAVATRLGLALVATVIVGAVLGYGIDLWLGSAPWAMIVGVFFGGIGGMLNVYRRVMRTGV